MELRIEEKGNISVVYLDKINLILGANKSGKTRKLDKLNEVFKGNSDYALINGVEVNNGIFNVIYIRENRDIESEIEIKSKSAFHMNVVKPLVNNNSEKLIHLIEEFSNGVNDILKEESNKDFNYELSDNYIATNSKKLEKLETILFEISSTEKHSMGSKEEFYFYQALLNLKEGINNIILIDDTDRYLDSQILAKFLQVIESRNDTTIIMSSKNKYLLYDLSLYKYIDSKLKTIELEPIAKELMFDEFRKLDNSNISLDSYILQNDNFYSKSDYKQFLKVNFMKILEKITIWSVKKAHN